MRRSAILLLILMCLSSNLSAEIVLFKRTTDLIKPVDGVEVTVWLTDAVNLLIGPLNKEGAQLFDEVSQVAFMQTLEERINKEQLQMLVLVSLVASAKMQKYGVDRLPTAIQIDRDGTVVRRVTGVREIQEFLQW